MITGSPGWPTLPLTPGHRRPKDGVLSHAYVAGIHQLQLPGTEPPPFLARPRESGDPRRDPKAPTKALTYCFGIFRLRGNVGELGPRKTKPVRNSRCN